MRHITNTASFAVLPQTSSLLNLLIKQTMSGLRLPWSWAVFAKKYLYLFKGLPRRLRVCQVRLEGRREIEHTEDNERLLANVVEGRRHKKAQREIKQLIRNTSQRHTRGTCFKGLDLGCVDPSYGCKSQSVDDDEETAECDDSVGRPACDADHNIQVSSYAFWDVCSVCAEHAPDNELADAHADGAVDQKGPATGVIDEEECDGGEYDEKCVLHARGYEVDVSRQAGHLEDVDHIVGHHICPVDDSRVTTFTLG